MRRLVRMLLLTTVTLILAFSKVHAAECTIPNSFTAGTKAVAAQVNANFDAVKSAVDDNDNRITALEAAITAMQTRITDLETENDDLRARLEVVESNSVLALDGVLSYGIDHSGYDVALFEGVNVQIVNGSGTTSGSVTGTGNLVIGYNEIRGAGDARTGSHNLIVGQQNNYLSYGGIVSGYVNSISNYYASVIGGRLNQATGDSTVVSGGSNNIASGYCCSVSGGRNNTASGSRASVSGGRRNEATGDYSSVSGGCFDIASGTFTSVSGGLRNEASGLYSTVSGGSSLTEADNYGLANPYHP